MTWQLVVLTSARRLTWQKGVYFYFLDLCCASAVLLIIVQPYLNLLHSFIFNILRVTHRTLFMLLLVVLLFFIATVSVAIVTNADLHFLFIEP